MPNMHLVTKAMAELANNPEQNAAVSTKNHCVVLAGPGSGKTKTLTVAMARALCEDVAPPRGIACITYNNECALELEERLSRLGIQPSERIFIGTVHSFALTQVVYPYARCVLPYFKSGFRVATKDECTQARQSAYEKLVQTTRVETPLKQLWEECAYKRKRCVDRTQPSWRRDSPTLTRLVEYYEEDLRRRGLIDFDDMALIAYRMVQQHAWISMALQAKYPVLFVDEYQDLGYALHELVLELCFSSGIRLFAVGDPDQSIYDFTGANPELLENLAARIDVECISLKLNYRCATKIIQASTAALGETRDYRAVDGAGDGRVMFRAVDGGLAEQAEFVANNLLPQILGQGKNLGQIAVLYRLAEHGDKLASAIVNCKRITDQIHSEKPTTKVGYTLENHNEKPTRGG